MLSKVQTIHSYPSLSCTYTTHKQHSLFFPISMKSLQDLTSIPKFSPFLQTTSTTNLLPFSFSLPKTHQIPLPTPIFSKIASTHLPTKSKFKFADTHLKALSLLTSFTFTFPSFAAEVEQAPDKISIESIIVAIDDFFNRYPFFVAGCAFIWLVVSPLTEEYLKKCKYISAFDAFRKLQDLPNSQLLDIRREKSLNYIKSPNLKVLGKSAVQVEFVEGEEEGFVKEVLERFSDPGNTVLCVLDK